MWIDKVLDCIGLVRKSQVKTKVVVKEIIIEKESPKPENDISVEDKRENIILLDGKDKFFDLCHRCLTLMKRFKDKRFKFELDVDYKGEIEATFYLYPVKETSHSIHCYPKSSDSDEKLDKYWEDITSDINYYVSRED